jgi:hypothetical protein
MDLLMSHTRYYVPQKAKVESWAEKGKTHEGLLAR